MAMVFIILLMWGLKECRNSSLWCELCLSLLGESSGGSNIFRMGDGLRVVLWLFRGLAGLMRFLGGLTGWNGFRMQCGVFTR